MDPVGREQVTEIEITRSRATSLWITGGTRGTYTDDDDRRKLYFSYLAFPVTAWALYASLRFGRLTQLKLTPLEWGAVPRNAAVEWALAALLGACCWACAVIVGDLSRALSRWRRIEGGRWHSLRRFGVPGCVIAVVLLAVTVSTLFFSTYAGFTAFQLAVQREIHLYRLKATAHWFDIVSLALVLVILMALTTYGVFQLALGRGRYPASERVIAVGCMASALIAMIAALDWWFSHAQTNLFAVQGPIASATTALTKVQAAYFAITSFTTLGLGDVHPATDTGRVLVMLQAVLGIVILAGGISLVMSRASSGISREDAEEADPRQRP